QLPLPKTGTTRSVTDLADTLNHRGRSPRYSSGRIAEASSAANNSKASPAPSRTCRAGNQLTAPERLARPSRAAATLRPVPVWIVSWYRSRQVSVTLRGRRGSCRDIQEAGQYPGLPWRPAAYEDAGPAGRWGFTRIHRRAGPDG